MHAWKSEQGKSDQSSHRIKGQRVVPGRVRGVVEQVGQVLRLSRSEPREPRDDDDDERQGLGDREEVDHSDNVSNLQKN